MDPQVLLLDEPLCALDALTRATLQDEIDRIWERDKKTVVLITNDVDEGILLADRIIPLTPGPGATLGPCVPSTSPRPRDRKAHEPRPGLQGDPPASSSGSSARRQRPRRSPSLAASRSAQPNAGAGQTHAAHDRVRSAHRRRPVHRRARKRAYSASTASTSRSRQCPSWDAGSPTRFPTARSTRPTCSSASRSP